MKFSVQPSGEIVEWLVNQERCKIKLTDRPTQAYSDLRNSDADAYFAFEAVPNVIKHFSGGI